MSIIVDIGHVSTIIDFMKTLVKTPAQLGRMLKERRLQLRKDQASIAKKASISRAWLVVVESGAPGVSIGIILRLLNALKLSAVIETPETEEPSRARGISNLPNIDINQFLTTLRNPSKGLRSYRRREE